MLLDHLVELQLAQGPCRDPGLAGDDIGRARLAHR